MSNTSATIDTQPVLHIDNLTVKYAGKAALEAVSLSVRPGQIVALVGENGAGKTTLLQSLFGNRRFSSGSVQVCGLDPSRPRQRRALWREARFISDEPVLHDYLTVDEHLRFFGRMYGVPESIVPQRALAVAQTLELEAVRGERIGSLSLGTRRKVHIASAFIAVPPPRLLVFDEPAAGLDPPSQMALFKALRRYARAGNRSRRTVIISSHRLAELSGISDSVVLLQDGAVVREGSIEELSSQQDSNLSYIAVLFGPTSEALAEQIEEDLHLSAQVLGPRRLRVRCQGAEDVGDLLDIVRRSDRRFQLRELREEHSTVERIFIEEYRNPHSV